MLPPLIYIILEIIFRNKFVSLSFSVLVAFLLIDANRFLLLIGKMTQLTTNNTISIIITIGIIYYSFIWIIQYTHKNYNYFLIIKNMVGKKTLFFIMIFFEEIFKIKNKVPEYEKVQPIGQIFQYILTISLIFLLIEEGNKVEIILIAGLNFFAIIWIALFLNKQKNNLKYKIPKDISFKKKNKMKLLIWIFAIIFMITIFNILITLIISLLFKIISTIIDQYKQNKHKKNFEKILFKSYAKTLPKTIIWSVNLILILLYNQIMQININENVTNAEINIMLLYIIIIICISYVAYISKSTLIGILLFLPYIVTIFFSNSNEYTRITVIVAILIPLYSAFAFKFLSQIKSFLSKKEIYKFIIAYIIMILLLVIIIITQLILITYMIFLIGIILMLKTKSKYFSL